MANKLLQQEVGDNFDTIQSSNSNGNWRGRAQVIRDLQQKNSELREKLKGLQDVDRVRTEISPQVIKLTNRLESLTKENAELKESFQDVKRKFETSKARSKVFESDCSIMRSKINKILEENDQYRDAVASLTVEYKKFGNNLIGFWVFLRAKLCVLKIYRTKPLTKSRFSFKN